MAYTNDNLMPIAPTSEAVKGLKWLLLRCYGYFQSFLQKFFKSGIKQKEYSNNHFKNIPIFDNITPQNIPLFGFCLSKYSQGVLII